MSSLLRTIISSTDKPIYKYLDIFRGRTAKSVHFKGLIEKQHPELWKVPKKYYALKYTCNTLPLLSLPSTQHKLVITIIGHTWNFGKASEFISRKQFLEGKYNYSTDECLVGPANISASSLTPGLDALVQSGVIWRITIAHPAGPKTMYSPNPLIGGLLPYDTDTRERNWNHSSHSEWLRDTIDETQSPLIHNCVNIEIIHFELFRNLLTKLRHIEILPVFLEEFKNDFNTFCKTRKNLKASLMEYMIESKNGPMRLDGINFEDFNSMIFFDEDEVNSNEGEFLNLNSVDETISELEQRRRELNSPLPLGISQEQAEYQLRLLWSQWGEILLTFSVDAWDRYEKLIETYGAGFAGNMSFYVERYKAMKEEREKYPWINSCVQSFFSHKTTQPTMIKD